MMNTKSKIACVLTALCLLVAPSSLVFADGVDSSEIADNTRYFWTTWLSNADAVDILQAISSGQLPLWMYNSVQQTMQQMAADSATNANSALIAYANASTSGGSPSYTIRDNYSFVAKRRINYPYNEWYEVDYLYCYVDENATTYTTQQFGDYAVTANSFLLIRDTSFDGVKAYSIPMAQNGITIFTSYNDGLRINFDSNGTFVYDSAEGTQTVSARHDFQNVVKNNDYNTIACNQLIDFYNNFGQSSFSVYHAWGEPLSVFECFAGLGYNSELSDGFSSYRVGFPDWYLSTGYFNTQYPINYITNNTNNNNTTVINPANAPVYVVPNDNPWHSGNTIDENTIENYADYGLILDNDEFELDVVALAGALAGEIVPVISGLLDGVFSAQPEIGMQFGQGADDYNLIQLFDDYLIQIVDSPAERPLVPVITTFSEQNFDLSIFSTSVTYPLEIHQGSNLLWSTGESVLNALGIPFVILFGLALFGIAVWVIF